MGRICSILLAAALLVPAARGVAQEGELSFNAGLNHLRDGRSDLAIAAFKKAIDEDDKNPYFYKGLGIAYMRADKPKDAIKAFEKALDLNPYYVDVRNDMGTALILLGEREQGKRQFIQAFNDPQNPTPEISAHNLGQAYMEERSYAQALNWFRTSLQRNETYPGAYVGLSDTLLALGRGDEAVAQLELGVEKMPSDVQLKLALGEAYYGVGRFSEARKQLETVAARDPSGPLGRRALGLLGRFPK